MSQEYLLSIVLVVGSLLKVFGVEIDNKALEGLVAGTVALWIAIRRHSKGDISVLGAKLK